jgi:hypothetical protein
MTTSLALDVKCHLSSVTTGRYQFASKKGEHPRGRRALFHGSRRAHRRISNRQSTIWTDLPESRSAGNGHAVCGRTDRDELHSAVSGERSAVRLTVHLTVRCIVQQLVSPVTLFCDQGHFNCIPKCQTREEETSTISCEGDRHGLDAGWDNADGE